MLQRHKNNADEKRSCNDFFFRQHILCCQCTNKFSPFWGYSQWTKLNRQPKTDYYFPFSRHECGTTTGGCVGTKTSTLSACGCLSISFFIFLLVAHEQKYASDSSITATANISRAICLLLCIFPRFVYDYRRMSWFIIRRLIYHRTRCSSSSVAGIPLHEIFVIILPTVTIR